MPKKRLTLEPPDEAPGHHSAEWVRFPKSGQTLLGLNRSILQALQRAGSIRTLSLAEAGRARGVRLIHLPSVEDYLAGLYARQHLGESPEVEFFGLVENALFGPGGASRGAVRAITAAALAELLLTHPETRESARRLMVNPRTAAGYLLKLGNSPRITAYPSGTGLVPTWSIYPPEEVAQA